MRKNPTEAEGMLWEKLRLSKTGYKFRQQAIILGYIADFYCPCASLVIEIDGKIHEDRVEYDNKRTAAIESKGIKVIRFTNEQIYLTIDEVLKDICFILESRAKEAIEE